MSEARKWPLLQACADVLQLVRTRILHAGKAPPRGAPPDTHRLALDSTRLAALQIRFSSLALCSDEAPRAGVARALH
jgi:hypothetical protein